MPSRVSRQFNELHNGIKNGISTGSAPRNMRNAYQKLLVDSLGNPRDPMQIYNESGVSIGVKGATGITELPGFGGIDNSSLSGYTKHNGGFTVELYPVSSDYIEQLRGPTGPDGPTLTEEQLRGAGPVNYGATLTEDQLRGAGPVNYYK